MISLNLTIINLFDRLYIICKHEKRRRNTAAPPSSFCLQLQGTPTRLREIVSSRSPFSIIKALNLAFPI